MKNKLIALMSLIIAGLYGCEKNHEPVIHEINCSPESGIAGTTFVLIVNATDEDGDLLAYQWSADGGEFTDGMDKAQAKWKSPDDGAGETFTISVNVSDGSCSVSSTFDIVLSESIESSLTDSRDGHTYDCKTIGTQTWMIENLAYLPSVSPSSDGSDSSPYYYVHGYEGSIVSSAKATDNYDKYGTLYNFEAAKTACPDGWHLPSDEEWKTLEKYLGMSSADADDTEWRDSGDVGRKLKSASGWYNNGKGDNSSGFNACPGGIRNCYRGFLNLGYDAIFCSSSSDGSSNAWYRDLYYLGDGVCRDIGDRRSGFSVRCLRN